MTDVRGSYLLDRDPEELSNEFGFQIIHQSLWGTYNNGETPYQYLPKRLHESWSSWRKYHPESLCVLWSDDDNRELIRIFYPEFLTVYDGMRLVIQKCDFVRLLYLHRYGGVYADADYEAHENIFNRLPKGASVMVVESPVFLNEALQNGLMVATEQNQNVWINCARNIQEGMEFIANPKACYANGWGGCGFLQMFNNKLTSKLTNLIYTQFLTGPAAVDKTLVRMLSAGEDLHFKPLTSKEWFVGPIATHHQENSWVSIPKAIPEIIAIIVGALVIIALLIMVITLLLCKRRCRRQMIDAGCMHR